MSPRQRQVLFYVHDTLVGAGISPSIGEVAEQFAMSGAMAGKHLQALIAEGFLRRRDGQKTHRCLEVVRLPGRGLLAVEVAWCHANPERVRAMMALLGASPTRVEATAAAPNGQARDDLTVDEAVEEARVKLAGLQPGGAVILALPSEQPFRRRAYHKVSLMAIRQWGRGTIDRTSRPDGLLLRLRELQT